MLLDSKTPAIVASWVTQPGNSVLAAVEGDRILAIGSATDRDRIQAFSLGIHRL